MRTLILGGLLASAMLVPALAQNNPPPAAPAPAAQTNTAPKVHGDMWRSSKLIGLNVYNDQNEKLGIDVRHTDFTHDINWRFSLSMKALYGPLTASKKRKPGALEPSTQPLGKLATSMRLSAPTSSKDCRNSPSANRTSGGRLIWRPLSFQTGRAMSAIGT